MDLASHASLESGMETGEELATAPARISRQGSAASSLRDLLPDAPSGSNAIRRMLAAQLPSQGTSSGLQVGILTLNPKLSNFRTLNPIRVGLGCCTSAVVSCGGSCTTDLGF